MTTRALWRIGVPVAGLAVAVAVGWRLSPVVLALVIVCAWLPLVAWCVFAPRVPAALPVALALLAAVATVRLTLPGQPGDRTPLVAWSTLMWYPVPSGIALLAATRRARWRETRTADRPVRRSPSRVVANLVAVAALVLGCGCGGAANLLFWDDVSTPSPDELFPLPAGMDASDATGPNGPDGCDQGGHACWTYYRVTGAPGESAAALRERLWRHLRAARGWDGTGNCTPVHRFGQLSATDLCVALVDERRGGGDRPAVGVELSMTNIPDPN